MRAVGLLVALVLVGLVIMPSVAYPRDTSRVKKVTTTFVGQVTDRYGHQLQLKGGVIKLQLFEFFGNAWPREYWATIECTPDRAGLIHSTAEFPVDQVSIDNLKKVSQGRSQIPNRLGIRVLNKDDQQLSLPDGIKIIFRQIGKDAWPPGDELVVQGGTDDQGMIWATAMFPINAVTLNNLALMVRGQGQ